MPKIIIDKDSLLGGLKSDKIGLAHSQEANSNQYVRITNAVDLYRYGLEGHITSGAIFGAGVSNAGITSLPRAVAVDVTATTPNIYYILGGLAGTAPKTVKTQSPSTYTSSAAISAHGGHNFTTLPSTGYWGEDIIAYKVASTFYIFYSWNDNADGDVGRMAMDGSGADDDFMSTVAASGAVLTAAVPHKMVEGPDGKLYITNGRYVSSFDGSNGANGTYDPTAYDGGVGWIATDVRVYGNLLAVSWVKAGAAYISYTYNSDSRMTLWNMTEPGLGLVYNILDNFCSAIFPLPNGGMLAFTVGRNNTVKVWELAGQGFRKLWESVLYTSSPDPRQIDMYKDLVCWISGGYGLALDLTTKGVHVPFLLNDGTDGITTGGFLKNTDQSYLLMGGLFAGTYKTVLAGTATGYSSLNNDLRTRVYKLPFKSTITDVRVYFSQFVSGASATFSIFKNYTSSSIGTAGTDMLNKTITTAGTTEYHFNDVVITNVSAFYMNIRVSGQVSVSRIEIDWSPSQG